MNKKNEKSTKTARIIIVANSIIILFGILTFIGWYTDFDFLASIQGRYIPMSRDTALFFILLGSISILLGYKNSKTFIKIFYFILLFIAVYGMLKFAEYFIHFDLTFEDVWLPVSDETELWPVKRMSPYTGFLYMFSGIAILLSVPKNITKVQENISSIFGILIFILSFVAVTGYLFDSPLLYGSGVIPIALNTAVAFMFLGFSIIVSTQNSYVVNYVISNEILKTLLFTFIPLITILIFTITLLTKVVLQDNRTNIGLVTSLVSLIALFVVIMIIIPISRRITNKIDNANSDLFESEEKYKQLGDMLPLSMVHYHIVHDVERNKIDFQILGINKKLEELLGMKSADLVGRNLRDVFPQTEQYWIEHYEEVAISGKTAIFEDYSIAIDKYLKVIAYKIDESKMAVVIEDVTENRRKQKEILYISYHDSLTDLHNRRYYEDNLGKLDIPENYPLTIVMSDINGLKLLNDAFGHRAGDKLLISATKVILKHCRETDLTARIGGDEFVIVMPNTSEIEAEKIINRINTDAKKINIESIELSISFGFATKNKIEEDIQEVFRSAEDLMYRVKLVEIPSMRSGAIETILYTLHEKDKNSEIHSRTVSKISEKIARAYGMNIQEVNEVKTAGLLHDIGKIIIPISIITKKGKLTTEEYTLIKGHPEIGFRILNSTHDMRNISNIVLSHHERWDGLGYPRGIKAEDIPLQSRIIAIADAFDAMTSERTYREILTKKEALKELLDNAGTQFDPELVDVFKLHFDDITIDL